MKLSEITSRLNGISTPFFGVSWTPATADVQVARGVISYLEGRRLLTNSSMCKPYPGWGGERAERSAYETRSFLTDTLVRGGIGEELAATVRFMRQACMEFLDASERWSDFNESMSGERGEHWEESLDPRTDEGREALERFEDIAAHLELYQETMTRLGSLLAEKYKL